ncbi:hypothetical protein [Flavobacterium sp. UMI-01]|uniref:hypothetical protein n=1 Tax=Flavobacterium sp. UMI-01 TaxID=1441053 RepID=UPI001C7DA5A1|nr:hypothetical protein [Flavobacterium sp. UMI-01]GIZ10003.1 hypothetical protein FUMI01_27290 [Flavobacterium sp. UMI-01]
MNRTYTVKIRSGEIWKFKYNLKGVLIHFEVMEGDLTDKQETFLYHKGKFPWKEAHLKDWEKLYPPTTVEMTDFDLSFENIWKQYNLKVKKENSEKAWNKLSDQDKIKCFLRLKKYNANLATNGQAKAHLVTWINQKRYNDED